jgi:hypothetical protein
MALEAEAGLVPGLSVDQEKSGRYYSGCLQASKGKKEIAK